MRYGLKDILVQGFCPLKVKITQCPEGFCLKIPRSNYLSLVHTYPDIFETATLIFHSGCGFRQRVSGESGIRIRSESGIVLTLNRDIFF